MVEARNNTSSPIISTSAEQFITPQELIDQLERAMKSSCVRQVDIVVELPPGVSMKYQEELLSLLDKEKLSYDISYSTGGAFLLTLLKAHHPLQRSVRLITRRTFVGGLDD